MELILVILAVLLCTVFAIPFFPNYMINAAHENVEAPNNEYGFDDRLMSR